MAHLRSDRDAQIGSFWRADKPGRPSSSDLQVRSVVQEPCRRYLWANSEIIRSAAKALLNNLDLDQLTPADKETLLDFAFERYWASSSLLGGRETFTARADRLRVMGVDEVACLIDFGVGLDTTLASLERIAETMCLGK